MGHTTYLITGHTVGHSVPDAEDARLPEALLERYEDENTCLRQELERLHRELERKDAMLLTLAQRVPELEPAQEAPSEPSESLHTPSEDVGKGGPPLLVAPPLRRLGHMDILFYRNSQESFGCSGIYCGSVGR